MLTSCFYLLSCAMRLIQISVIAVFYQENLMMHNLKKMTLGCKIRYHIEIIFHDYHVWKKNFSYILCCFLKDTISIICLLKDNEYLLQ